MLKIVFYVTTYGYENAKGLIWGNKCVNLLKNISQVKNIKIIINSKWTPKCYSKN